jgi:acetyl esterase/lipase
MLDAARLWACLGYPDGPPRLPSAKLGPKTDHADAVLHRLTLHTGSADIAGLYLCPAGPGPHPAVLYCHAHGNRYDRGADELIEGRPALQSPYGSALAKLGIASLSIDLAPFGARQSQGPETALAKAASWQGRTLMGDMLAELSQALDWLVGRPEIDAGRVATLGLSMGGTHAYWLAALDPRIAAAAHLCVFSDIAPLIAQGTHDLHGPYMTVPGLLTFGDMADVAALIAPRPQFVGLGALDPLTPDLPDSPALIRLHAAYSTCPEALRVIVSPDTGHVETPDMRRETLAFLVKALKP